MNYLGSTLAYSVDDLYSTLVDFWSTRAQSRLLDYGTGDLLSKNPGGMNADLIVGVC